MLLSGYEVWYFQKRSNGRVPVREYVDAQTAHVRTKIYSYIDLLVDSSGYLEEPYSRHVRGSVRELRVDFGKNRHRVFYFTMTGRRIILLHAYHKKSPKAPWREVDTALRNHEEYLVSQLGIKYL